MDELDLAAHQEQLATEIAIARARRPAVELLATGQCLWCGDELQEAGRRFCGPECRDDFDKRDIRNG